MLTPELLHQIQLDYTEQWLTYPGVVKIDLRENLLRVLVQDESVEEAMPKTYLHESGYELGIEFVTVARQALIDAAKQQES